MFIIHTNHSLRVFFFLNISSAIFNILRIVFDRSKGFFEGETAGRGKEKNERWRMKWLGVLKVL